MRNQEEETLLLSSKELDINKKSKRSLKRLMIRQIKGGCPGRYSRESEGEENVVE